MCLSDDAGRGERDCSEYLNKYFSIKFTRPDKTIEARAMKEP
ncbi:TrbM/KikA/MpfK family conjugal transfer protein [Advenella kashmirensis]